MTPLSTAAPSKNANHVPLDQRLAVVRQVSPDCPQRDGDGEEDEAGGGEPCRLLRLELAEVQVEQENEHSHRDSYAARVGESASPSPHRGSVESPTHAPCGGGGGPREVLQQPK
eukprot:CAMPEP_0119486756 /NCGR_PEP_ID=MMETSP1344-20130328/13061_1 /TAXON_ID=236787 /ORGANISM="Florenciella parvula, Strain CCMP2471" /LENGTH=113 /DNA_ID=CAMNT_0007521547 /DNA_START=10 /DNA_END=349 /DNA_ORIENTATION=-